MREIAPLRVLDRISRLTVWILGMALILIAFIVSAEVILRQFFDVGSTIGMEYSSYILAISSAFAFSYALLKRGHVRVDFIKIVSPRIEIFADILALLSILLLAGFLTYFAYGVLSESLSLMAVSSSSLQTPLFIPQGLWFFGLIFFTLTSAVLLAAAVIRIWRGNIAAASALISVPSITKEIEDVLHDRDAGNSH